MGEDRPRYNAVFNARTRVGHNLPCATGGFRAGCDGRQNGAAAGQQRNSDTEKEL